MEDFQSRVDALVRERDELKGHCQRLQAMIDQLGYPPGHFYSPVVDAKDPGALKAVRGRLAARAPAGVDLDASRMQRMMERLAAHHYRFCFPRNREQPYRFHFGNPFFAVHDASVYFSMLLEFRPKRVIEAGCGYSSCLLLDTKEIFLGGEAEITLIDPSLDELLPLFGAKGVAGARLFVDRLQNVPTEVFQELEAGDFLFIDSSHVGKTGSDVNWYLFEILPMLKPGVLVHIHDVLYPFEYLESWIVDYKRSWNEAYLAHAFLQYNSAYEIVYWTNFVFHRLGDQLRRLMPLCLENEGGSLWLRRVR